MKDDAFDPARLVSNNTEFVTKDHATVVINFGGIAVAARPQLNTAGVAQIVQGGETVLSDVKKFPDSRAFVPDTSWEGELQGRYIKEKIPEGVVGFMGFNNELADSRLAGLAKAGVKPVKALRLPPGQGDIASQVTELKAAKVDTLVVTLGPPTLGALLSYMGQIDYHPQVFIGSPYADFASTVKPAGAANVKGAFSHQWLDPQNPAVHNEKALVQYRADMAKYARGGRRPVVRADRLRTGRGRRLGPQRRRGGHQQGIPGLVGLPVRGGGPAPCRRSEPDRRIRRPTGARVPAPRVQRHQLGAAGLHRQCVAERNIRLSRRAVTGPDENPLSGFTPVQGREFRHDTLARGSTPGCSAVCERMQWGEHHHGEADARAESGAHAGEAPERGT
ncbi:ABC transporter substrate-binding protein [Streptomyces sp. T028]|uniref:ABC transporter substrate-binding protein n=1 Tax=Streptomyces sp. T028 TaxID=3394379 RepID=UPI003A892939